VKFFELPADPFDDNIVFEPREAEPAVAGLNAGSSSNSASWKSRRPPRASPCA
jgi:hypothetical protein